MASSTGRVRPSLRMLGVLAPGMLRWLSARRARFSPRALRETITTRLLKIRGRVVFFDCENARIFYVHFLQCRRTRSNSKGHSSRAFISCKCSPALNKVSVLARNKNPYAREMLEELKIEEKAEESVSNTSIALQEKEN